MTRIAAASQYLPPSTASADAPSATGAAGQSRRASQGSFASQAWGTQPQPQLDLQLAMMANDVYHPPTDRPQGLAETGYDQALADAGWSRLRPAANGQHLVNAAGEKVAISPRLLSNPKSGFDAGIYQNDQGQFVLAFRGTDNWFDSPSDGPTNIGQGIGLSPAQYEQATRLALRAQQVLGEGNFVVTGHSLGGGLASAAMLATGAPGVTFNAAPLHDNTLRSLAQGRSANAVREELATSGQIRRYNVKADLLTGAAQQAPFFNAIPNAVGHELRLPAPTGSQAWNPVRMHGGGGPRAAYVEALREHQAYRPGSSLQDQLQEHLGEWGLNTLAALGTNGYRNSVQILGVAQDKGQQAANALWQGLAEGRPQDGALRAAGHVLSAGLNVGASTMQHASNFIGDAVMEMGTWQGKGLRTLGQALGQPGRYSAQALAVEAAGAHVNNLVDTAGAHAASALSQLGQSIEQGADRLALAPPWTTRLGQLARRATHQAGEAAQWAADQAAQGAQWAGDRLQEARHWLQGSKLNPANW